MKEIQLEEMWGKINKALTSENKTFLESKTAKILPNNPTSQGFSADQIRKSLYEGILVLFEWLKTTNNSNVDFNNKVMETLTAITENNEEDKQDLANLKQALIDGTFNVKYLTWAIMATNDENGNRIIDTYATIERLTQVLEALTQEISDRKAADDLEKKERKEETSAIINSVNQEISDRTNAVSVLNNLLTAETENRASEDEKVLQYAQSVSEALGNAKTDLQGKIDSEAQTRLANDNEIKASITSKEDSLKALINSVKNELNGYITTLNNRVNNLPTNYVFDTYESMTSDLLNASNTKYKVGDTLFIKEVNKPDYWVSAILSTKGTYGYYEISIQESKVDLSNYVKISELSREAIEEKFLETVENGRTKSFAARSFAATSRNSGIDLNNYAEYGYDGVSFHKNGMEYPLGFPEKDGVFALTSDIPQALKNPFALTINGKVYDGSSAVEVITETITEHDFVRFWHDGIEIQNDGSEHVLRFSDFDTELEEFSPHISCQYDGPQYYWVWKFPQISGTFAMESQIPTKLSQLTNDGNYQTNTSDLKDNTTTFTTASTRSNVASGEKLSVSFGKISKYFNDLKAVAFSGNKSDIGLGNVDNTSDADKPVSNATQQALNLKANASDVYTKNETDNGINKSLYNLGYYDTITANSDGTYTITRQTGYIVLDGVNEEGTTITKNDDNTTYRYTFNIVNGYGINGGVISNLLSSVLFENLSSGSSGIAMYSSNRCSICINDLTTIEQYKTYLANNNISIQYKLATSYTEKVEKNHYARYNQRFILDHNKSEAERSANLFDENSMLEIGGIGDRGEDWNITTRKRSLYIRVNPNVNYYLTINEANKFNIFSYNINKDFISKVVGGKITTPSDCYYIRFYGDLNITRIMLNEGTIALPYQPYNENKHITNYEALFLKTEHERSANLTYATSIRSTSTIYDNCITLAPFDYKNGVTYHLSFNTENTSCVLYLNNHTDLGINYMGVIADGTRKTFTFTPTKDVLNYSLRVSKNVDDGKSTGTCSNVMLNIGSTPLPYQPYEGKIVHEKELGDKLNNYVDKSNLGFTTFNVRRGQSQSTQINGYWAAMIKSNQFGNPTLPSDGWWHVISMDWTGNTPSNWYSQLALPTMDGGVPHYRRNDNSSGGTNIDNSIWRAFITDENIVSTLSSNLKTINGNSIVGSGDLTITPGIFTKLGNKTNFSFDSGSYLVVANNGLVTVTGTDPLNVGSSANKKFVGIFMVTIAEYGGGQSVCVNTEEVFSGEAASATISGPMFTIYRLN